MYRPITIRRATPELRKLMRIANDAERALKDLQRHIKVEQELIKARKKNVLALREVFDGTGNIPAHDENADTVVRTFDTIIYTKPEIISHVSTGSGGF